MPDQINHPPHYTSHPSGVECIQVAEHMSYSLGCVIKYLWRADLKSDAIEDLKKARWYLDREIARREQSPPVPQCPDFNCDVMDCPHWQNACCDCDAVPADPTNPHPFIKP